MIDFRKIRGFGKRILDLMPKDNNSITLRNEDVAKKLGCDIRTMQRWTSRFVKLGIIKIEQAPFYDGNIFTALKNEEELIY